MLPFCPPQHLPGTVPFPTLCTPPPGHLRSSTQPTPLAIAAAALSVMVYFPVVAGCPPAGDGGEVPAGAAADTPVAARYPPAGDGGQVPAGAPVDVPVAVGNAPAGDGGELPARAAADISGAAAGDGGQEPAGAPVDVPVAVGYPPAGDGAEVPAGAAAAMPVAAGYPLAGNGKEVPAGSAVVGTVADVPVLAAYPQAGDGGEVPAGAEAVAPVVAGYPPAGEVGDEPSGVPVDVPLAVGYPPAGDGGKVTAGAEADVPVAAGYAPADDGAEVPARAAGEVPVAPQAAVPPPAAAAADELVCVANDFFSASDDTDVDKDRWMTVRTFLSAMLAEPVPNVFNGCDGLEVEVLARALIDAVPSSVWVQLAPCVTPVVFVWQFLLLARSAMDASPAFCQAVGELMIFTLFAEEETLPRWEAKARPAARAYRDMWAAGDADAYQSWLLTVGVRPAVSHLTARDESKARVIEQANEKRTGQAWPGRVVLRAFPEDSTAERERNKAAAKKKTERPKTKEAKKGWDVDDCRHGFPTSTLRAPGVITFMCGCGYIMGFELLRETESPAHVVAALVQRFKKLPRVIYFDTACQAQRNALRRVPWLMEGVCTAWFIDRFHRCNHNCSPVFNADQFPSLTRGHDTSGAERQHSIKKRSKNSLSYMTQRRFIVRSRYIAAHNNVRVSQRRQASKAANAGRGPGERKVAAEIQHKPVETYYHHYIVSECELPACPCRLEVLHGARVGLEKKV